MKRVLLTGATGFIGRHCPLLLTARGYEVHAVSSRPPEEGGSPVAWHQANLLDARQSAALMADVRPTHLLHFAWYAVPGEYWASQSNLLWVQASLGLVEEFARQGGQRVVVAGSCAEYDWRYGYCSEDVTPLAPATLYGVCKHSLQLMLTAFSKQTGISAAWGRIFFVFGPHEHPNRLVASVVRSILRGEPALCTRGDQIRDLLYVEDVADAFVTLLESNAAGPVNVASGKPVVLQHVIRAIADKQNRPDLVQLGALPTREGDPPLLVADVYRLQGEIGWTPRYDLDGALSKTISWWKERMGVN